MKWIRFSIEVFERLLEAKDVRLANDPADARSADSRRSALDGTAYLLLECFPTSTWRSAGLRSLPGHRRVDARGIGEHSRSLARCFGLPPGCHTENHDDLQAVVAALPAAGLAGGPCTPVARGEPSRTTTDPVLHRVEGLIWDAVPVAGPSPAPTWAGR